MKAGMSEKLPWKFAKSEARDALSASDPQVVQPQALKMNWSSLYVSAENQAYHGFYTHMESSNGIRFPKAD